MNTLFGEQHGEGLEWLFNSVKADADGRIDHALDIVFDNIDQMMIDGKWGEIDALFSILPDSPSIAFLIGFLSITLPGSEKLPSRASFFDRVWKTCLERGRPAGTLLIGLREWKPFLDL